MQIYYVCIIAVMLLIRPHFVFKFFSHLDSTTLAPVLLLKRKKYKDSKYISKKITEAETERDGLTKTLCGACVC
jgi:hypothetical protein